MSLIKPCGEPAEENVRKGAAANRISKAGKERYGSIFDAHAAIG